MTKINFIKTIIEENNGVLLTSDLQKHNIARQYIVELINQGYIEKVQRGIYVLTGMNANEFFCMQQKYKKDWFEEDGARYQIQFSIMKDEASLYIDTTGIGLHKRGYRPVGNAAPLRETLAASMVQISRYRGREAFYDPFCGSGTIPIEAAQ